MNTEATYDLIERYLNNTLTAVEKAEVEKRIQDDPSFYEEVESHRAVNSIISDNAALEIKKQLQQIHIENTTSSGSGYRKLYYGLGAIIGLSLVAVLVINNKDDKPKRGNHTPEQTKNETTIVPNIEPPKKETEVTKTNAENTFDFSKHPARAEKKKDLQLTGHPDDFIIEGTWHTDEDKALAEDQNETSTPNKNEEPQPENTTTTKTIENSNCEGVSIEIKYTAVKTCGGQKNGAIVFDTESLEPGAFEFSVDGGKTYSQNNRIENLGVGNYTLMIRDKENCKSKTVAVQIEKENCDHIIRPQQQKYWEVPLEKFKGEQVQLKITDGKTGRVVYMQEIPAGSSSFTWQGTDDNNTELPMGVYVYELFSNNTSFHYNMKGTVTIAR